MDPESEPVPARSARRPFHVHRAGERWVVLRQGDVVALAEFHAKGPALQDALARAAELQVGVLVVEGAQPGPPAASGEPIQSSALMHS